MAATTMPFFIRAALPGDVPMVLALVHELAEYERLVHEVDATEDDLREALFGSRPCAEVLIAGIDGDVIVGFALFFHNFSTFRGRPGIYLEDLYVRPEYRGAGIGRALLARLASLAVERGCRRLEWSVLDWNAPAIGFYTALGAEPMHGWTVFRLTDASLAALAGSSG